MNRHTELIKPNLTAEFAAADDIPLVRADRKRIAQVLTNLIENAFKYTDHGYVRVTAIKDQFPDGRAAAHIAVWDSGPGISVHDQEHIFRIFTGIQRDQPARGLDSRLLSVLWNATSVRFGRLGGDEGSTFHVRIPSGCRWSGFRAPPFTYQNRCDDLDIRLDWADGLLTFGRRTFRYVRHPFDLRTQRARRFICRLAL